MIWHMYVIDYETIVNGIKAGFCLYFLLFLFVKLFGKFMVF